MLATPLKRISSNDSIELVKGPLNLKKSKLTESSPALQVSDGSTKSARPRRDPKRSKRYGSPEPLTTSPTSPPRPRPIAKNNILRKSLPSTSRSAQNGAAHTPATIPQIPLTPNDLIIPSTSPVTPTVVKGKLLSAGSNGATDTSQAVETPQNSVSTPTKRANPTKTIQTPIRAFLLPSRARLDPPPLSPPANSDEQVSSQRADDAKMSGKRKRKSNEILHSVPSPSKNPRKTPKETHRTSSVDGPVIELSDSDEGCTGSRRGLKKARTAKPTTPTSSNSKQQPELPGIINLCSEDEVVTERSDKPATKPLPSRKALQRRVTIATSNDASFVPKTRTSSRSNLPAPEITRSKTLNTIHRERSESVEVGPVFLASSSPPGVGHVYPLSEHSPQQLTSNEREEPLISATSPVQPPSHDDGEPSPISYVNPSHQLVNKDNDNIIVPPSLPLPEPESTILRASREGNDDDDDFYVPSPTQGAGNREESTFEPEMPHSSNADRDKPLENGHSDVESAPVPLFLPDFDQSQPEDETSSITLPSVDSQITLGDSQADNDQQTVQRDATASASSAMAVSPSTSTKNSNSCDILEVSSFRPASTTRKKSATNTNVKHAASIGPGTPTVYDPTSMPQLITPRFFSQSCLPPRLSITPLATGNGILSPEIFSQDLSSIPDPHHNNVLNAVIFEEPEQQEPEVMSTTVCEDLSLSALEKEDSVQDPKENPPKEEAKVTEPNVDSSPPRIDLAKFLRKKKTKKNHIQCTDKVFPVTVVAPVARPYVQEKVTLSAPSPAAGNLKTIAISATSASNTSQAAEVSSAASIARDPVSEPESQDVTEEMILNDPYLAALVKESALYCQAIFPDHIPTATSPDTEPSNTDSPVIPDNNIKHTTAAYSPGDRQDSTSTHESPSPITPPTTSSNELFFIHPTDTVNFDLNMFAVPSVDIPDYGDSKSDDIIDDEDFLATHQLVYPDSLS